VCRRSAAEEPLFIRSSRSTFHLSSLIVSRREPASQPRSFAIASTSMGDFWSGDGVWDSDSDGESDGGGGGGAAVVVALGRSADFEIEDVNVRLQGAEMEYLEPNCCLAAHLAAEDCVSSCTRGETWVRRRQSAALRSSIVLYIFSMRN
jgi:hypothetical protein